MLGNPGDMDGDGRDELAVVTFRGAAGPGVLRVFPGAQAGLARTPSVTIEAR